MNGLHAAFVRADLDVIRAVFANDGEIALTLGVDPHELATWGGDELPDKPIRDRLHQFAEAVRALCEHYDARAVPDWFDADHADAGRPADMLQADDYEALRAEIADAVAIGYS